MIYLPPDSAEYKWLLGLADGKRRFEVPKTIKTVHGDITLVESPLVPVGEVWTEKDLAKAFSRLTGDDIRREYMCRWVDEPAEDKP